MFEEKVRRGHRIQVWLFSLLAGLCLLFTSPKTAMAAGSVNVSVSSASGEVGSQVTVDISVSAGSGTVSGTDFEVNFDPSVLSPADGSGGSSAHIADISTYTDKTFSLTFNVVGAGSSPVSVASSSAQFISDDEDVMAVSAASGTVTGKVAGGSGNSGNSGSADSGNSGSGSADSGNSGSAGSGSSDSGSAGSGSGSEDSGTPDSGSSGAAAVLDGNTSLSSLDVYPGSIGFSADTHSYSVDVSSDTDQLQVSAVPASGTSRVSVSDTALVVGDNTVTITVTAENGATAEYVVHVRRGAEETTTQAATAETTEETSEQQTETVPTVTVLGTVVSPERTFDILELPAGTAVPSGFSPVTVTIGGSDYTAYQNSSGLVIFYGRPASDDDTDFAGVGWYSYQASDGSIQAVPAQLLSPASPTRQVTTADAADKSAEKTVDYRWKGLACVLALVVLLLLVLMIVFLVRGKSGPQGGDGDKDGWTHADGPDDGTDGPKGSVPGSQMRGLEDEDPDEFEDLDDDILAGGPDDGEEDDRMPDAGQVPYRSLEPDEKTLADGVSRIMSEDDGMETLDIDETTSQK